MPHCNRRRGKRQRGCVVAIMDCGLATRLQAFRKTLNKSLEFGAANEESFRFNVLQE